MNSIRQLPEQLDRAKTRLYIITTPRKRLVATFRANLNLSHAIFDMFFASGEFRALHLYHDATEPENLCESASITKGFSS